MNQDKVEMQKMKKGVKLYLKTLGLDMTKYVGCAKTDTKIIAVIDKTIILISHELDRHRVRVID